MLVNLTSLAKKPHFNCAGSKLTFLPQLNQFAVICATCPIFATINALKHTSAIPDDIFGSASQSVTFKSPSAVHASVGNFGVQV